MVQNAFKLHSTTFIPLIRYKSTNLLAVNKTTLQPLFNASQQCNSKRNRVMRKNTDFFQFNFLVFKGRGLWNVGEDTGWKSHAFTSLLDSQERLICLINKLLDIPNNRSVRKEQEMDSKRKATVEGSRNKKAK